MGPDEKCLNSEWCYSFNSINYSSCCSKPWSDGEILDWIFLRVITLFWMCSDENMLDFSFGSSHIWFRLSSCILKGWFSVSCDTCISLADESIIILCCLSWHVYLNCCSSSYFCLIIWSDCSWKGSVFWIRNQSRVFVCLSINILCCLSWYVSLKCCGSYSSCLLLWYHFSWNSFISMAKESIKSFCSYLWLYGGSMDSCFE